MVMILVFYICHLVGTKGGINNNAFKKYFKHWYQNLEMSQLSLPYSKSAVSMEFVVQNCYLHIYMVTSLQPVY